MYPTLYICGKLQKGFLKPGVNAECGINAEKCYTVFFHNFKIRTSNFQTAVAGYKNSGN